MNQHNSWDYFQIFYSLPHTQKYLLNKYDSFSKAEKLSFENSYTFIYYLEHGKKYYQQANIAPIELQPVLLFYGMIQLIKAVILSIDPFYPNTTQVLAHGVSTRKRKKLEYIFLEDEVKIQRNGLFSHFSKTIFQLHKLEGEKYKMGDLMKHIPELHIIFYHLYQKNLSCCLTDEGADLYGISSTILDKLHLSATSFIHYLNERGAAKITLKKETDKKIILHISKELKSYKSSPFLFNLTANQYYLLANSKLHHFLPELLVHYLILYNLSMVCRYEADWWGNLFHQYPSNDLPFINAFLDITKIKVPYYLSLLLKE